MAGLQSFEDFTRLKAEKLAAVEAQKQTEAREEIARSFKDLLAEYGVTKVSELDEEKRSEFFSRLEGTDLNESLSLVTEGTRSFFGKIDRKGKIEAVYMHYDGYPENMLPLIQKGYSGSKRKNIDVVLQNGAGSGLEADPNKINYYNDGTKTLTGNAGSIRDFIGDVKDSWGEYIYLYDERDGEWYMVDAYEDSDLKPAFESVEINEAVGTFPIQSRRIANKVVTQYNHLFGKTYTSLVDGKSMQLGAVKVLFQAAMEDANFSREGNEIAKYIKGGLSTIVTTVSGLGNIQAKVSARTIQDALYNEASRISNAAEWGGLGIVEGTALYLESIGYEAIGGQLVSAFHAQFESKEVMEARLVEGNAFGAARAKAIADGKDEFTVDGETYKVTSVDKEDKENAEEFAGESTVTENYEVIYSDGISAMKKFRTEAQALDFMKQTIASNKKLRDIAVYKPGMYSTTETDKVVSFWGNGSYLDNVSKKDPKLAAKKLEESVVTEAEVKSADEFKEYAFTVLQKAFGEDFDEAKAQEVVDGILDKCGDDYGACVGMLQSSLG